MNRISLAFVTSVLVVGCSSGPTGASDSASLSTGSAGWRKGIVLQAGTADSLGPPIDNDCRKQARADTNPAQRYVEIQYFVGRHAHLRIVPIGDEAQVSEGGTVYFRSFGCANARAAGPAGS